MYRRYIYIYIFTYELMHLPKTSQKKNIQEQVGSHSHLPGLAPRLDISRAPDGCTPTGAGGAGWLDRDHRQTLGQPSSEMSWKLEMRKMWSSCCPSVWQSLYTSIPCLTPSNQTPAATEAKPTMVVFRCQDRRSGGMSIVAMGRIQKTWSILLVCILFL